jgi:hypothetical protein
MREGVMFSVELETRGLQLRLDLVDQSGVSQWIPGVGAVWSGDVVDRPTVDQFCATV